MTDEIADILSSQVYIDGANRPFGEITFDQARGRGEELKAAVGFGPTARVAPVARAWRELSMVLERAGAQRVADLPEADVRELAPKLWVTPPGGSLL